MGDRRLRCASHAARAILACVAHRDDHEASRHRIAALERELEEARARAERAEVDARGAKEALARRGRERPRDAAPKPDPRWPAPRRARFVRAVALATVLLDLPIVVLLAGWRSDLDDADAGLLGWTLLPPLVLLPVVYVLARWQRAPFPSSALMVSTLASGVGWMAVLGGASDMFWSDVLAEPPWRWLARGAAGLLGVALHAVLTAAWSAEAALSDTSAGD